MNSMSAMNSMSQVIQSIQAGGVTGGHESNLLHLIITDGPYIKTSINHVLTFTDFPKEEILVSHFLNDI